MEVRGGVPIVRRMGCVAITRYFSTGPVVVRLAGMEMNVNVNVNVNVRKWLPH